MGCDMTEQTVLQLTEAELTELVISSIEAFQYSDGPYLEREHCSLARKHSYNEGRIAQFWRDAAEQAHQDLATTQSRLSAVVGRFDALRPKIEEAKRKHAEPKAIGFRRFPKKEQSSANSVLSFSVPAVQPLADEEARDTPADDDIVEDDLQRINEAGHKLWRLESALPFVSQSMSEDVGALLWFMSRV